MRALIEHHLWSRRLTMEELFRAAYHSTQLKHLPEQLLQEELACYRNTGNSPDFLVKYIIGIYGCQ